MDHVTTADELADALTRTPPPAGDLAGLRSALQAADERVMLARYDETRRAIEAAYALVPTDRPWPCGDATEPDDAGEWQPAFAGLGSYLAAVAADVWHRLTGRS